MAFQLLQAGLALKLSVLKRRVGMQRRLIKQGNIGLIKYCNRNVLAVAAAMALGLSAPKLASATFIAENNNNDTAGTAQNVNGNFSLDADPNINNNGNNDISTTIPHVSIRAASDPNGSRDFFRFSSAGGTIILDIDLTEGDTEIGIWNAAGTLLGSNDDLDFGDPPGPDTGSPTVLNSFLQLSSQLAGDYFVGVCTWPCTFNDGFAMDTVNFDSYVLHISTEPGTTPAPEPTSMILLGSGLVGLGAYSRRRNAKKS
jgi:hypothetical protein